MARVYFPEDVDNFIASCGHDRVEILSDLAVIGEVGPESLDFCSKHASEIWEYRRPIAPSRYAFLLFAYYANIDSYVVLPGFRGGREGPTGSDLRWARRRRKAN